MPKKKIAPSIEVNVAPLLTRPDRIAIVCLGLSVDSFFREMMSDGQFKKRFDEIWVINRAIGSLQFDKAFIMDDFKWIEKHKPDYAAAIKNCDKPVITTTRYDDYPNAVEYPYHQVMETIQDDIFNVNGVAYAVAYAIHIGVAEMSLYGADFAYPDGNKAESGGQAVAYLLGVAKERGINHRIPSNSTLLYANTVRMMEGNQMGRPPYGFHRISEMRKNAEKEAARKRLQEESK